MARCAIKLSTWNLLGDGRGIAGGRVWSLPSCPFSTCTLTVAISRPQILLVFSRQGPAQGSWTSPLPKRSGPVLPSE